MFHAMLGPNQHDKPLSLAIGKILGPSIRELFVGDHCGYIG
jgi:hypothetical protein